ncbi:MAG: hypothetical protein AB2556_22360 [Candidatus Thiodiazotropha sp.]
MANKPSSLSISSFFRTAAPIGHKRLSAKLGDPELADRAFGENHAASITAKDKNDWRPTPGSFLLDIQKACVEHGHGGLGNSMDYDTRKDLYRHEGLLPGILPGHG